MLVGDVGGLGSATRKPSSRARLERIAEFDEQLAAQASVVSHARLVEHGDRSLDLHGRCGLGRLPPCQRCRGFEYQPMAASASAAEPVLAR